MSKTCLPNMLHRRTQDKISMITSFAVTLSIIKVATKGLIVASVGAVGQDFMDGEAPSLHREYVDKAAA